MIRFGKRLDCEVVSDGRWEAEREGGREKTRRRERSSLLIFIIVYQRMHNKLDPILDTSLTSTFTFLTINSTPLLNDS